MVQPDIRALAAFIRALQKIYERSQRYTSGKINIREVLPLYERLAERIERSLYFLSSTKPLLPAAAYERFNRIYERSPRLFEHFKRYTSG
ncbi:hypothetical protein [Sporosarcina sp. NCCP-2222]|uniref:hypothetical protein n=1 Tax=Sporosarcina sp. NCCP-2222 TaxID=2935073 RepID=UPI0020C06A6C|nr:hypothetical protein [Sporosarcina sp. NCCP-2222]